MPRNPAVFLLAIVAIVLLRPGIAQETDYPPDYADGLSGGPDFWVVINVPANDVLNVRAAPGTAGDIKGALANGDVAHNRGCKMHGEQRWCRVQTLSEQPTEGWVNAHYLAESASPDISGREVVIDNDGGPIVSVRGSGEVEVLFDEGCVALFDSRGKVINAGSSCSVSQLEQAQAAVAGYLGR